MLILVTDFIMIKFPTLFGGEWVGPGGICFTPFVWPRFSANPSGQTLICFSSSLGLTQMVEGGFQNWKAKSKNSYV